MWIALLVLGLSPTLAAQKIKDVARVEGVRSQQLSGIGLVMGLAGTGDTSRNDLTRRLYRAHLENLGLELDEAELRSRNIAAVMVTATITSWTKTGSEIQVNIASMGDAKSLRNGWLLQTHLYRPRRSVDDDPFARVYALAQGAVSVRGETETVGLGKATVEGDLSFPIHTRDLASFRIILNKPDFSTASSIANAINGSPFLRIVAKEELPLAHPNDLGSITVTIPKSYRTQKRVIDFISKIMTDTPIDDVDPEAKVIIDKKTGGVAYNSKVRGSPVVVIYKGLEIRIGTGDPGDPNADRRPQPLVQVLWQLERSGLTPEDWPAIIHLIHDAGALNGRLIER